MNKLLVRGVLVKTKVEQKVKNTLKNNNGEGYVDTGVKVLMAVVIGALVLGGLYALFKGVILPTMEDKVIEMFNYKG